MIIRRKNDGRWKVVTQFSQHAKKGEDGTVLAVFATEAEAKAWVEERVQAAEQAAERKTRKYYRRR